jgi:FlaA1/EpsC-like NDP-sugar epimerase
MYNVDSDLLAKVLRREISLFATDIESSRPELENAIRHRKILVIGAAGSIGAAFVRQLIPYKPAALHLIDISENGLVEIVRELRSSTLEAPADFQTFSIGMGSPEFRAFVRSDFDYDIVLNFAALKHVRAERDPYSLLRMLNTNFVYLDDFLSAVRPEDSLRQVFSVSSDKSVNPASLLGSSKALMEEVLQKHADRFITTSARFANVAFSAGSLLESFLQRLSKRQPLAAPNDVKRFFISHEEAGELCLLGAFLGESGDIVFPGLNPQSDMLTFSEIALTVLDHFGYEARYCDDELEARGAASGLTGDPNSPWPVYFSASNTSGEKMFEEFHGDDETVSQDRWDSVGIVSKSVLTAEAVARLDTCLDELRAATNGSRLSKQQLVSVIQPLIHELALVETGRNLDNKM